MTEKKTRSDAEDIDAPTTKESIRGGPEPPPEVNDRPDQNVAYDEVVKGRPLRRSNGGS